MRRLAALLALALVALPTTAAAQAHHPPTRVQHGPPRPTPKAPPKGESTKLGLRARSTTSCGTDATASLNAVFAHYASHPGSTLVLGYKACYTVNESLIIKGTTHFTIQGNGATFRQTALPGAPMLELWDNTNLAIENLTLDGATTGDAAGGEINYGVVFEADNGVVMSADTIENMGGDWVYLSPPYDVDNVTDLLNTGITMSYDKFLNAGYHGFTIESVGCWTAAACNGFTLIGSTLENIQEDGMDWEYDDFSTGFQIANGAGGNCTPTAANATTCLPFWAAQDYITIGEAGAKANRWINWNGSDWFASIQGQAPGVQAQHEVISYNTLEGNGPFMEINGTYNWNTTAPYLNSDWAVFNNAYAPGYSVAPYRGGTSASSDLQGVYDLDVYANSLRQCNGTYPTCADPPKSYAIQAIGTSGTIAGNDFTGELAVIEPQSYDPQNVLAMCWNTYGPWGATLIDASCT